MLNTAKISLHRREVYFMCNKTSCVHPEKKVKHPKECPPEQIAECHPESKSHPCAE